MAPRRHPPDSVMKRRVYYDHEPVYRRVAERGGAGWDDRHDDPDDDSYVGLDTFISDYVIGRTTGRTTDGTTDGTTGRTADGKLGAILDLGCGGGQAALRFADLAERIVGIDYAETAIDLARQNAKAIPHARFEVGDITRLETLTPGFDVIVDNHALHCLVEDHHRAAMLQTVAHLLSPGGLFFSETMSREGRFDPTRADASPPDYISTNRTRRWRSAAELDQELTTAGLTILERRIRPLRPDDPPVGDLVWVVAGAASGT